MDLAAGIGHKKAPRANRGARLGMQIAGAIGDLFGRGEPRADPAVMSCQARRALRGALDFSAAARREIIA